MSTNSKGPERQNVLVWTSSEKLGCSGSLISVIVFLLGVQAGLYTLTASLCFLALAVVGRFWLHLRSGYRLPLHIKDTKEPDEIASFFYGEFAGALVTLVMLFGIVYFAWEYVHPELFIEKPAKGREAFVDALYYSFLTLTTTGVPPLRSTARGLQVVVMTEIGCGITMFGLFLGTMPKFSGSAAK